MAEAIRMPRQGQSVETCIITKWLKEIGDRVEEGDLLFSYETDKAAFDHASGVEGILLAVFYEEGDEVAVLNTVAVVGNKGEDISAFRESEAEGGSKDALEAGKDDEGHDNSSLAGLTVNPVSAEPDRIGEYPIQNYSDSPRISPRARKMAEAHRIDLYNINGSGPNGRIIAADVERLLKQRGTATPKKEVKFFKGNEEYTDEKLSSIRKIISTRMHQSLQMSAQLTHHTSADARRILSLRNQVKAGKAPALPDATNLNDMVCFALVEVLKENPDINAHFLGDRLRKFRNVHLGIAVDTDRGLMVPSIRNADNYTLGELGEAIREVANACRNGTVDPDLLAPEAATFTVSNLGIYGIELFTPVLNLPQCGILGVNTIVQRPADLGDGSIGFIPHIGLSLTYDHRALDGAPASRFLLDVKRKIEILDYNLL
jgi:pyruvate dehydrogenase E2 component (dihydrolipoamide acetyltransferase)